MQTVIAFIKDFWGLIAAVVGICGVVYKYLVAPYLKRRKARENKMDAVLKQQTDALTDLKTAVSELSADVGFLQHDRLQQGHDHFMRLGYCPPADLANLTTMYDRYIARGRNSLFATYKQDLLSLPPAPDIKWGKREPNRNEEGA